MGHFALASKATSIVEELVPTKGAEAFKKTSAPFCFILELIFC
jgi:hypothetical protein